MARSSNQDPLEKFRFTVTVLSIDLSVTGAADAIAGALQSAAGSGFARTAGKTLSVVSRAGFSNVSLPEAEVNTMNYRENIDAQRFSKVPGLVRYKPVTLKRGATNSRDLFNWYRLVNDDLALTATANELAGGVNPPKQSENFRKEVIINVQNRAGESVKQWILFNAYPSRFKGGDNLDAKDDSEKLVEELELTYDFFLELEGGLDGFAKELVKDIAESGLESVIQNNVPSLF